MSKKICLISSGQPSANPRLIKEALAYSDSGCSVTVLYCSLSLWADNYDKTVITRYETIHWVRVGYHPMRTPFLYFLTRLRQKFYILLYGFGIKNACVSLRSMALYTQELTKSAKKIKSDLYVGHNLAALPAAILAAEENNALAVFDFEDFHRGEEKCGSRHWQKVKIIEDQYVSRLCFATSASPLIRDAYAQLYPDLKVYTINNCFPLKYVQNRNVNRKFNGLKLFWFSQFVGKKRGIETVIKSIGVSGNRDISLTLMGNCTSQMKIYFETIAKENGLLYEQLFFLPVVREEDIVSIASNYDLGLACEEPHVLNRDFCLTNKIFLYLLSGNAILFSNTKAQSQFYESHPDTGSIYEYTDHHQLATILNFYSLNNDILKSHQEASLYLGVSYYNWDIEKMKFLKLISNIVN